MRMCTDDVIGLLNPLTTWAGAEFGGAQWNDYWDERRHLPDVLANYKGSVYLVWGMQDWNVDPYHAFPTYQLMRDAGINARAIAGQWAHNYPDQPDRHSEMGSGYGAEAYPNMSRMDWAVELYGWFNYYLKDIGEEPEPMVQMQTHDGKWHVEETWPPSDMEWWSVALDGVEGTGAPSTPTINAVSPCLPSRTTPTYRACRRFISRSTRWRATADKSSPRCTQTDFELATPRWTFATETEATTPTQQHLLGLHHADGVQPHGRGFERGNGR